MRAEIICLYAYDVAHEADLPALESSLRGSAEWFDLGQLKDAPRSFPVYRPLSLRINDFSAEGPAGPVTLQASVKLFSVGALSVKIRVPVDIVSLAGLVPYRDLKFKDGSTVDSHAQEIAGQVFAKLKGQLGGPVAALPQPEGYTVFWMESFPAAGGSAADSEACLHASERELAALLVGEPDPARLSVQEVEETLRYRYSYYTSDLVVVDWDAALVVESPADYQDVLYVMELANLQLEELRAYDQILDQALDKAYGDVERATRILQVAERRRILGELRGIRMDVTKVSDEISNITKFFGDWHLARVYLGCSARFHLKDWEQNVSQKLRALDSLYTMLQTDSNNRMMMILETAIVALFILDLIIIVWMGK